MIEKALLLVIQICAILTYFPQIIKTLRMKKCDDVAISAWVIALFSLFSYSVYGFLIKDKFIIFTCLTETVLAVITVILLLKYRLYPKK